MFEGLKCFFEGHPDFEVIGKPYPYRRGTSHPFAGETGWGRAWDIPIRCTRCGDIVNSHHSAPSLLQRHITFWGTGEKANKICFKLNAMIPDELDLFLSTIKDLPIDETADSYSSGRTFHQSSTASKWNIASNITKRLNNLNSDDLKKMLDQVNEIDLTCTECGLVTKDPTIFNHHIVSDHLGVLENELLEKEHSDLSRNRNKSDTEKKNHTNETLGMFLFFGLIIVFFASPFVWMYYYFNSITFNPFIQTTFNIIALIGAFLFLTLIPFVYKVLYETSRGYIT